MENQFNLNIRSAKEQLLKNYDQEQEIIPHRKEFFFHYFFFKGPNLEYHLIYLLRKVYSTIFTTGQYNILVQFSYFLLIFFVISRVFHVMVGTNFVMVGTLHVSVLYKDAFGPRTLAAI
jgi:hypothetical protein